MHLIDNDTIQHAIKEISPTHIAVAYIGSDWDTFVDPNRIQEIVLSPTLGSNPWAINQLQRRIGWDRIFFLDELHAKIYLGNDAAAIGSFNLTRNGFDVRGLLEYGVKIDTPQQVRQIRQQFGEIVELARARYPSAASKKQRLAKLIEISNRAAAENILRFANLDASLANYQPLTNNDFYVCWWQSYPLELDQSKKLRKLPELKELDLSDIAKDWTSARDDDPIEENKWVLLWHARMDGFPFARGKLKWLYVHQVIRDVVDNDHYKTLIMQRKHSHVPPEPFSVDSTATQDALKACLALPKFKKYRPHSTRAWSTEFVASNLISLIEAAQAKERSDA